MRALVVSVAVASVLAAAVAAPGAGDSASRASVTCRQPLLADFGGKVYRYTVRVERGRLTCAKAAATLKTFIVRSLIPRGWACFLGHSPNRWAASCARGRIVIRAYARR